MKYKLKHTAHSTQRHRVCVLCVVCAEDGHAEHRAQTADGTTAQSREQSTRAHSTQHTHTMMETFDKTIKRSTFAFCESYFLRIPRTLHRYSVSSRKLDSSIPPVAFSNQRGINFVSRSKCNRHFGLMCDRTQDFIKCVEGCAITTIKKRIGEAPKTRTAFHNDASEIAKGIHRTSGVLNKLTKLVRQQGLFDDSSDEINNLIFRVKQDLDELKSKCDSAQSFVKADPKDRNQSASHNGNVVCQLNANILLAQKDFKTVLDTRASKMKESQNRKEALTGKATNFTWASNIAQSEQKPQPKFHSATNVSGMQPMPMGVITPYNGQSIPADYSDFDDQNGQSNQKLLFAPLKVNQYYESRETAINEVEKTIHEFGQLFLRLTSMIGEQQEMVERIDDDVESAMENTEKGMNAFKVGPRLQTNIYTKVGFLLAAFLMFFLLFLM